MIKIQIVRQYFQTHTAGVLLGLPKLIYTIERPWVGNQPKVSCIPEGTYRVAWREANWSRFPRAFQILNVPDRSGILIHSANLARQLHGCIAPGLSRGFIAGESAILSSVAAVNFLESHLPKNSQFLLVIGASNDN